MEFIGIEMKFQLIKCIFSETADKFLKNSFFFGISSMGQNVSQYNGRRLLAVSKKIYKHIAIVS